MHGRDGKSQLHTLCLVKSPYNPPPPSPPQPPSRVLRTINTVGTTTHTITGPTSQPYRVPPKPNSTSSELSSQEAERRSSTARFLWSTCSCRGWQPWSGSQRCRRSSSDGGATSAEERGPAAGAERGSRSGSGLRGWPRLPGCRSDDFRFRRTWRGPRSRCSRTFVSEG